MRDRTRWTTCIAGTLIAATLASGLAGCKLQRKLPWVSTESIVDSDPGLPRITLGSAEGFHTVVMQAPSGGWTVRIDKSIRTAEGMRIYVTARRPDPAFSHTQAFVDLNALSDVPTDVPVTIVGRVLERDAQPKDRMYGRITQTTQE